MFDKIIGAVRKQVETALPTGFVKTANILFDALDREISKLPAGDRAVNISGENGESRQVTLGRNPRFQFDGYALVTVYEPSTNGDGLLLTGLSTLSDGLRNRRLNGTNYSVRILAPSIGNGARSGSHWVKVLRVPFRADYYPTVN